MYPCHSAFINVGQISVPNFIVLRKNNRHSWRGSNVEEAIDKVALRDLEKKPVLKDIIKFTENTDNGVLW